MRLAKTPEESALNSFEIDTQAYIVGITYKLADHAVVQVGFPGHEASYHLNVFRYQDGWHQEMPDWATRESQLARKMTDNLEEEES